MPSSAGPLANSTPPAGPSNRKHSLETPNGGTLYVGAPYFGGSIAAVEELRSRLKPKKVKVFPAVHDGDALDVPLKKLEPIPGVSVHRLALGDGRGRIYIVEPTGPIVDDPNLTDKKFPGNPTQSYRSRDPLRIIGEVTEWEGHSPERLKQMKDSIARAKALGIEVID